jgi:membrane protein DedA with SNARE-associated domain
MNGGIAEILLSHPGVDPLLAGFVFLLCFGFTLPIPEELALVITGLTLRSVGRPYLEVAAVACLALALSDLGYYSIARFLGPRLIRVRLLRGIFKSGKIEESERYFARRGPRILFVCRFVVGLRAAAIMSAGFLRLPCRRFLSRDLPALCIGAPLWLAVGFSIGLQFERGIGALGRALSVVGPVAAVVAGILVYRGVMADRSKFAVRGGAA